MGTETIGQKTSLQPIITALMGLGLGLSLHFIGFTDYDQIFQMFVFDDLRLFLTFAGAVGIGMIGLQTVARKQKLPHQTIHKGVIPGAVLFGIGWALTGGCPGVVLTQIGEGKWVALFTFVGILVGSFIYKLVHAKYFRWDRGSCG